jgi:hypothetical protein
MNIAKSEPSLMALLDALQKVDARVRDLKLELSLAFYSADNGWLLAAARLRAAGERKAYELLMQGYNNQDRHRVGRMILSRQGKSPRDIRAEQKGEKR